MPFRIAVLALAAIALPLRAEDDLLRPDDPRGRLNARLRMEGTRTLEEQLAILGAAADEARKYGIGQDSAWQKASAVAGAAWINVGPAGGAQVSPIKQTVTDAGRIRKIVPHPTDPNILYVATSGGGVWKTFDAQAFLSTTTGPHWASITSGIGSQSVGSFAIDPNSPDRLFLGLGDPFDVRSPGFYTSDDGGITWAGPVSLGNATSTRDIVVDPASTGVVLVATDDGVFRNTEGGLGANWARASTIPSSDCWSISFVGPLTWLVACHGAVYRSTDNAASFAPVSLPTSDVGRMTLAAAPSDVSQPATARVYLLAANASSTNPEQQDVFRSNDGGRTFTSLGMYATSACEPTCAQPRFWTNDQPDLDVLHDQAWYNQAILVDPRDRNVVFVGGNLAMMRSSDGGANWYVVSDWLPGNPQMATTQLPYVHADFHAMAIATSGGTPYFFAGSDGGIFRSSDVFSAYPQSSDPNGNCYNGSCIHFETRLNRGIATHLVYSIASDLHDVSNPVILGGLQDNGTRLRVASSPTSFNQVFGGDGFGVGIGIKGGATCSSKPWGTLLVATIYDNIKRSVDCGANFQAAMQGICGKPALMTGECGVAPGPNFFMKIASEPADTTGQTFLTVINDSDCSGGADQCTVAYGVNNVFASHNGAFSWTNANGDTAFPSELLFVGTNPKIVNQWAVTTYGGAYTTLDGGAHWKQTSSIPAYVVSSVAFEGTSGQILWATTKETSGQILRSTDRGASWTDKSAGFPHVPANVVAVDPNDSQTVYVGTEIGLYRSRDGGSTWARYGTGLPLVSVTEINVMLDSSAIRISTFGRGFWELTQTPGQPAGVLGNGDLDRNQVLDGFDLVREAGQLGNTTMVDGYDAAANLAGTTNTIDSGDFDVLVARLGGRP